MKRRILSIFTALALCLSLLPGTAWAAPPSTGVTVEYQGNSVTLTDEKFYVAAENKQGITEVDTEPESVPYLAYNSGTLTVHGAFVVNAIVIFNSDLTITGGEDSSLSVTSLQFGPPIQLNNHTLTLDGGVDFTGESSGVPVIISSAGKFKTTQNYSGDIALNCPVNIPAASGVTLDVKNSGSITVTGMISSYPGTPGTAVLKSSGDVSLTSNVVLAIPSLTVEGKNVSLTNNTESPVYTGNLLIIKATGDVTIRNGGQDGSPTIVSTAEISAGGNVTISGGSLPIVSDAEGVSLTVKNAQTVNITGKSSASNAFFLVPVTFENCNSVTVTDNGNGEILGDDVTLTSDKPWNLTAGGKTVTFSGSLTNAGAVSEETLVLQSTTHSTYWKAGEGRIFYEPPKAGNPAKLTLDNATYEGNISVVADAGEAPGVSIEVKGENHVGAILAEGSVSVTETNGTLNTFVAEIAFTQGKCDYTVYGKAELPVDVNLGQLEVSGDTDTASISLTVRPGAELTIPSGKTLEINELGHFENKGSIINNGIVKLAGTAAEGANADTVKALGLTGGGKVQVYKGDEPVNYTNSGVKLLDPAGELELSGTDATDANWENQGYKWTNVEKDDSGTITKGTLTLAPGFNATAVTLPGNGANVTVKTEGDSSIGELKYEGAGGAGASTSINLTFEGGKLTVDKRINFSGDVGTSVTIANGAVLEASKGITVSAAAGVDGTITVNGTLTARGEEGGAAVLTGKISVGPSGKLEVYGETGVFLGGMSTNDTDKTDFAGAFRLSPGGRFTGNCETDIIAAQRNNGGELEAGLKAEDAIVIPSGYLPSGLAPVFNNNRTKLSIPGSGPFNISSDNIRSSGGGSSFTTYTVTVEASSHGTVTSNRTRAGSGSTVTLTVTPEEGYALDALTVTDSRGNKIKLTAQGSGKYTFIMPSRDVTVKATFVHKLCDGGEDCPSRTFTDLGGVGTWYHEAVDYALRNGLMSGYGNGMFGPHDNLSRAQFAQVLFNKEGRPVVNYLLQYGDVADGAWYAEAVRWATSQGIVGGYGNGMFGPNDPITREQLTVMLWRYAGSPAATHKELHYNDTDKISGYALEALRWAVEQGIVNGKGDGILDPKGKATRAEVAAMLMRYLNK